MYLFTLKLLKPFIVYSIKNKKNCLKPAEKRFYEVCV